MKTDFMNNLVGRGKTATSRQQCGILQFFVFTSPALALTGSLCSPMAQ
ncbi:hypothetical protein [Terracidiphilus sp.]